MSNSGSSLEAISNFFKAGGLIDDFVIGINDQFFEGLQKNACSCEDEG